MDRDDLCDFFTEELRRLFPIAPPEPLFRQSHRWLYAAVEQGVPDEACFWDPNHRVGACGDWFQTPNIEGALLSGMALAGRVMGTHAKQIAPCVSSALFEKTRTSQLDLFSE
jgi:hypothetical protein